MAYTFAPIYFTGKDASEINSAVIESNRTTARKLLRIEDDVKNERVLTTISGGVSWQAYKEKIREADLDTLAANNSLKLGQRKVRPQKIMAFDTWLMDMLRFTRFAEGMSQGAANIMSTDFQTAVGGYLIPRMGKSYEALLYQSITAATQAAIAASNAPASQKAWAAAQTPFMFDGLIAKMIYAPDTDGAGGIVKSVVSQSLTASNALGEYGNIFNAIDDAELEEGNVKIFAPLADYKMLLMLNNQQAYRDKFVITGAGASSDISFLTVPIEFVPTGGPRFAGKAGETGDFVQVADLVSDDSTFEVNKVSNYSDELFYKMVASADTTVLNNYKKVLYL